MACLVFKIIYKLSPEYIYDIVEIKTSTYNFRAQRQAVKGKSQWLIQPGMDWGPSGQRSGNGTAFQLSCELQSHTPVS